MKKMISTIVSMAMLLSQVHIVPIFVQEVIAEETSDITLLKPEEDALDSTGSDNGKWKSVDDGDGKIHYETQYEYKFALDEDTGEEYYNPYDYPKDKCELEIEVGVTHVKADLQFDWRVNVTTGVGVLIYEIRDNEGRFVDGNGITGKMEEYQTRKVELMKGKYTLKFQYSGWPNDDRYEDYDSITPSGTAYVKNITMEPKDEMPLRYFSKKEDLINGNTEGRIAIGNRPEKQYYYDAGAHHFNEDNPETNGTREATVGTISCLICGKEDVKNENGDITGDGLVLYTEEPIIGAHCYTKRENTDDGLHEVVFPAGIYSNEFYHISTGSLDDEGYHPWESAQGGAGGAVFANHWGASDLRANLNSLVTSSATKIFRQAERDIIVPSTIKTIDAKSNNSNNNEFTEYETRDYLYAPRYAIKVPVPDGDIAVFTDIVTIGENDNFIICRNRWGGYYWLRSPYWNSGGAVIGFGRRDEDRTLHCANVSYGGGYNCQQATVAGFKIDLANVLFTSAAIANNESTKDKFLQIKKVESVIVDRQYDREYNETGDATGNYINETYCADVAPPMYIRLDPAKLTDASKQSFGGDAIDQLKNTSVTTTQGSSKISVANAPAGSRLMVQLAKSDGSVYQYSHDFVNGVGEDPNEIDLKEIEGVADLAGNYLAPVTGYAWVEIGAPEQTTVFPATEVREINILPNLDDASCDTEVIVGGKGTVSATLLSDFGENTLTWKISDPEIAKFIDGDDLADEITSSSESVNLQFKALKVGTATLTAEYNGVVLDSFEVQVSYLEFEGTPYIFDGGYTSGVEGPSPTYWLKHGTDAVLVPPEGYKISKVFGDRYDENGLIISDIDNVPDKIYLQRKEDGALTDAIEVQVSFARDSILPSGGILIDDVPRWQKIFSPITFNLFSTSDKIVKININDEESGPKGMRYLLENELLANSETESTLEQKNWKDYSGDGVLLGKNGKYIIYARLEDNVGNVDYLESEGVVVYSPSKLNEASIEYEKFCTENKMITFTANGNTIRSIKNGDKLLIKGIDFDESEEDGVVTITLKTEYLDSLSAGDYMLNIDYDPQGVEVGSSSEGELPEPLTIELKVKRKPAKPVYPSVDNVYKYGTKLSEVNLPEGWQWVNGDSVLGVGETEYEAICKINVEDYDWSNIEGVNEEDGTLTVKINVKSEVDKSGWGEPKEINGIMHYIDADGKTSVEISGICGIFWVKEESYGTSAWYGIDNSTGIFDPGSRVYVQWLSEGDPGYEELFAQVEQSTKIDVEGKKIWIFRIGVIHPNGEHYSILEHKVNLYVQIGDDWDEDEIQGYYISASEDEFVETTYTITTCPECEDLFGVMKLKHFSPYLIYDKLTENDIEKTESPNPEKTSTKVSEKSEPSHSEEPDEDLDEYDELLRKLLEEIDEPEDLEEKTPIKSTGDINSARSISALGVITLLSAAYLLLRKKKSSQI